MEHARISPGRAKLLLQQCEQMKLLLNLLIPGSGLILLRREWLGFFLAVVFGLGGNIALAGWLVAPAAMPAWLTVAAFASAALTWLVSQVLFRRQCLIRSRIADDLLAPPHQACSAVKKGEIASTETYVNGGRA